MLEQEAAVHEMVAAVVVATVEVKAVGAMHEAQVPEYIAVKTKPAPLRDPSE